MKTSDLHNRGINHLVYEQIEISMVCVNSQTKGSTSANRQE